MAKDSMEELDYSKYYRLETYLLDEVGPGFRKNGTLTTFDFFTIVVWKANRSKSKVAQRMLKVGAPLKLTTMDECVAKLAAELVKAGSAQKRLQVLLQSWGFRLPMASAILTILYPDEFTVYDVRVTGVLGKFAALGSVQYSEKLWTKYQAYVKAVRDAVPTKEKLRDKDRYLWGKSFALQLDADIAAKFTKPPKATKPKTSRNAKAGAASPKKGTKGRSVRSTRHP